MKTAEQVKTTKKVAYPISIRGMVDVFMSIVSCTFVQLWQVSIPHGLSVKSRFFGKVSKANALNCLTGYDYANMVNNARGREFLADVRQSIIDAGVPLDVLESFEKEITGIAKASIEKIRAAGGAFESAGLSWGKYLVDAVTGRQSKVVIEHTPKSGVWKDIYGYYIQVAVINSAKPVYRWIETGELLTEAEEAELIAELPEKTEGERQELKKPYIIRAPRFDTLQAVTVMGTYYELTA